jgi:membrane-associated phospholipid phosphatase
VIFRLRIEEAVALLFILPTTYLTVAANLYVREAGVLAERQPGGLVRLAVAIVLLGLLYVLVRFWPSAPWVIALREVLPFAACVLIYTNLHDTIGLVNPHDVHQSLIGLDQALFGFQPSVWAERFISRGLTELMSFLYINFFWIAPSTSLVLLLQRRWRAFREVTLAVITCFYLGYLLYVLFRRRRRGWCSSTSTRRSLEGYPRLFSNLEARAFELLPVDSRAAFPSLHAAVSLLALVSAWRHERRLFWPLLPFVLGLWLSTIYLRHHYFVDLLAGFLLAPLALWLAPRLDRW